MSIAEHSQESWNCESLSEESEPNTYAHPLWEESLIAHGQHITQS